MHGAVNSGSAFDANGMAEIRPASVKPPIAFHCYEHKMKIEQNSMHDVWGDRHAQPFSSIAVAITSGLVARKG